MSAAVVVASPQDLAQQVPGWEHIARTLEVVDQPSLQRAGNYIQAVKALEQQADEVFDPIIRKAHEAHREAIAQKRKITDPLVQAETALKSKMGAYLEQERQAREEEERQLRAEAERMAAEQREAEIEQAEAAGASREEISVLAQAPVYVPPVVRPAAPKVAGLSSREIWRAEVTDLIALVRHVAQNPHLVNLLQPNMVAVNSMARAMRGSMNLPGIRPIRDNGIAVRSRA